MAWYLVGGVWRCPQGLLRPMDPYPGSRLCLSISFENVDTTKKKLPVHILDGLTLSYKVPWPVDIVISSECQKIYNQVFLLLLQIKWAKYSLDVLLFGELAGQPPLQDGLLCGTGNGCPVWTTEETSEAADSSHVPLAREAYALCKQLTQLHHDQAPVFLRHPGPRPLLRLESAFFAADSGQSLPSSLQTPAGVCSLVPAALCLLACSAAFRALASASVRRKRPEDQILHSTGLEFQHQIEEAKDLDQLIKIHYRYLSTIHDRCLLREKVSFVKEAIMKVLNLALLFADGWQAGLGAWQMESIEKMESDFKNCHMFLVTILNKAVCRGSFPH
ncbi:hypothetical protein QTO34_005703, partial [Cnephaeus nilssonii]